MKMSNSRIILIFIALTALWGALVVRAVQVQILPDQKLANLQKRQFRTIVELPARRGSIMDRHGKELAVAVPSYSLYADPKMIKRPREWARKVGKILGQRWTTVYKKIKNKNRRFVWIRRQMPTDTRDKIKALDLKGLGFVEESQRIYPNESLLAQVLGFVGREGKGLEGLELRYDAELRGESRSLRVERDARGRPLVLDGRVFSEMPSGADVELTIDSEMQFVLEKALHESLVTFNADSALGVVMDAKASEILAMAYAPTFNANKALQFDSALWRNRAVTNMFEPGSVVKPLVVAGALKRGIVKPSTKIDCEQGRFKVGPYYIHEAEAHEKFGLLTVTEILARSSNVGTSKIALKMGDKAVRETLKEFGFGARTGINMPGEAKGILNSLPWRPHLLANVSIGQGVAVTPIQLLAAYGAIANGGELRTPIIVKRVRNQETGDEINYEAKTLRRVLSPEEAATLRLMLTQVTAKGGTGGSARVAGFPVAGKTGTAQKVDLEHGGYIRGEYISSFVGMLPSNDPRFVIMVSLNNPREAYYGSEVAAPVFARIAGYAVRKVGLAPVLISEKHVVPQHEVNHQTEAVRKIRAMARAIRMEEQNKTPDLIGLSLRDVYNRVRGTSIEVKVHGRGVVSSSSPAPGESLPSTRRIHIFLE